MEDFIGTWIRRQDLGLMHREHSGLFNLDFGAAGASLVHVRGSAGLSCEEPTLLRWLLPRHASGPRARG